MRRLLLLALLVFPAPAQAARFEQPPPTYNTTGSPLIVVLRTDGVNQAAGVAYKLSTEPGWHRCLPASPTLTLNLPAGDYRIDIADDTSRPWFDQNQPASTTPECSETIAPKAQAITTQWFYVRDAPAPPRDVRTAPVDTCGPELERVGRLHTRLDFASDRYAHRHTTARRRALKKARTAYQRARRTYLARC